MHNAVSCGDIFFFFLNAKADLQSSRTRFGTRARPLVSAFACAHFRRHLNLSHLSADFPLNMIENASGPREKEGRKKETGPKERCDPVSVLGYAKKKNGDGGLGRLFLQKSREAVQILKDWGTKQKNRGGVVTAIGNFCIPPRSRREARKRVGGGHVCVHKRTFVSEEGLMEC